MLPYFKTSGTVCSGRFKTFVTFLRFPSFSGFANKCHVLCGVFQDYLSVIGYFWLCKRMTFDRVLTAGRVDP